MLVVLKKDHVVLAAILLALVIGISVFGISYTPRADMAAATDGGERCVILDAGHGDEDPGAVSDNLKINEKDINLLIVKKVEDLLKKDGIKVTLTRSEDMLKYPEGMAGYTAKRKADLIGRKQMIDSSDADIVVSVHLNKFPQPQYWGAQAFYPHNSADSKMLAESIQGEIKKTADPKNEREALVRGKPNELPIVIFKDLTKPTVVVESGFLSNPEDEQRLASGGYQQKLAQAIRDGIMGYFKAK